MTGRKDASRGEDRAATRPPGPAVPVSPGGGDVDFALVMERYEGPLLRYVGQVLGPHCPENEDVVQEALIRLHRQVTRRGTHSVRQLSTWLYRVAHNLAIDAMRKRRSRREAVESERVTAEMDRRSAGKAGQWDALGALGQDEARQAAMLELRNLNENQRAAITLKVLEGMTMRQIGEVLGMAPSNVCYHLSQGLAELSRRLKDRGVI